MSSSSAPPITNPPIIRFYRATGEWGWLSNLDKSLVVLAGRSFPTAEHAYQFAKFSDRAQAEIAMQLDASYLAVLAHGLLPWQVTPNWTTAKVQRMRYVLRAKFIENSVLGQLLVGTGDATIIESSKSDAFWGIGKKGDGRNMLGVLLMELRGDLRASTDWPDLYRRTVQDRIDGRAEEVGVHPLGDI